MDSSTARLARVQTLFESALALPVDERGAWLAREEPALRSEVEGLLEAHESEGPVDAIAASLVRLGATAAGPPPHHSLDLQRIGPYVIDEPIGSGGMAVVYRARRADDDEARWVALKILRPDADSARVRRRFMAERQILAGLDHENIAKLVDDGLTPEGFPYVVTELVEGDPIDHHCEEHDIERRGRLRLLQQVCGAVAYAHSRGVVHRDLKPENILVTADGDLRLLDFGIAKILDDRIFPGLGRPTTTGVQVMTLANASPEQLRGEPVTRASDVYQLGLLLLRLYSGRVPPPHRRMSAAVTFEVPRPADESSGSGGDARLIDSVEGIVDKALSFRPEDRHASVEELILDIARALKPRSRLSPLRLAALVLGTILAVGTALALR